METYFGSMKYTNYSVDMPASVMHLLHWKADVWKNFSWKNKTFPPQRFMMTPNIFGEFLYAYLLSSK